jgi:hypothetical protein
VPPIAGKVTRYPARREPRACNREPAQIGVDPMRPTPIGAETKGRGVGHLCGGVPRVGEEACGQAPRPTRCVSIAWRTPSSSPRDALVGIVAVTIPVVKPRTNQQVVVSDGAACGPQNALTDGLSRGTRTLPAGLYDRKFVYAVVNHAVASAAVTNTS